MLSQIEKSGLILAIETSGDQCSVALGKNGSVLNAQTLEMPYGQSSLIFSLLASLGSSFDHQWQCLDKILVNRGPGSFTGLRTGISTARGLSLGHGIPVFGITSFSVCRAQSELSQPLSVFLKTRRGDYYSAHFKADQLAPAEMDIWAHPKVEKFIASTSCAVLTDCAILAEKGVLLHSFTAEQLFTACSMEGAAEEDCAPFYMRPPEIGERSKD